MQLVICCALTALNFILYFLFGSLFCSITGQKEKASASYMILAGFFFYYSLFTLFCVPVMYRWRPLSLLTLLWECAAAFLLVLSVITGYRRIAAFGRAFLGSIKENSLLYAGLILLTAIELIVVLNAYQFTLDAAYYVANVTTSLRTNSLNIYDPYTGDWQDHFEMRYFFATYPLQDAVMCSIFNIPALLQTKTVMSSVSIILSNMLFYMLARELFGDGKDNHRKIFLMVFFGILINAFFITIYTSSNFLLSRTYEGKSILGNVIIPALLLFGIRLYKSSFKGREWLFLFLICFGATVISNSSNMLVPAALGVLFMPVVFTFIWQKNFKEALLLFIKTGVCMLPGLILILVYVAYVKGMFVFYTYPR